MRDGYCVMARGIWFEHGDNLIGGDEIEYF